MFAKYRWLFLGVGAVLLVFLAWVIYTPIPFTLLKVAAVASSLALLLGVGLGFRWGKWVCCAVGTPILVVALWPSSKPDAAQLRVRYLGALVSYQGTPYMWGGENGRGSTVRD